MILDLPHQATCWDQTPLVLEILERGWPRLHVYARDDPERSANGIDVENAHDSWHRRNG